MALPDPSQIPVHEPTDPSSTSGSEIIEEKMTPDPEKKSFLSRAKAHLLETVTPDTLSDIELLILTFSTGIQDAVSFPDFHCFASNQTGNTVFLAVSLILPEMGNGSAFYTANIIVSLILFLAGAFLTGQLGHRLGRPTQRLFLFAANALQTLLVFAAATLQAVFRDAATGTGPVQLAVLALLAFATGSQIVQSRSLQTTEISTAAATAAWVDLVMDPRLLAVARKKKKTTTVTVTTTVTTTNRARNRRLLFLAALVAGALVGAALYRAAGSAVAIFVSAGGKAVVTGMFLFNSSAEQKARLEEREGRGQDAV